MNKRSVTLILTDIERLVPDDAHWPELPALQLLLSRGKREVQQCDQLSTLFSHFPLAGDVPNDLPSAALSALGDGLDAASGWWLCADPVHMVADRDQLYLSAADTLELESAEAEALVAELNALYAEDGWQFVAASSNRWYLRLPEPVEMQTVPTKTAMGRRVGEVLPQGEDALTWQRVMTEIQMLLHASSVNLERSAVGKLPVNSLWFWGGGELPQAGEPARWSRVVSDEPLSHGLARLHCIDSEQIAQEPLANIDRDTDVLLQLSPESLEWAERMLFAPLLVMLRAGKLDELLIQMPQRGSWHITRRDIKRWWRRRKPLAVLLEGAQ